MIKIINMLIAIVIIVITFFIGFAEVKISKKNTKRLLLLLISILSVFLAFRDIGLDLEVYRRVFQNQRVVNLSELANGGFFSNQLEPFFIILISFLKQSGLGFEHFLFLTGVIPMVLIYKIIIGAEDKNIIMTFSLFLLIFFFRGPIDVIRHFFAAAIYLSAIYSLSKQNKFMYWFKLLISVFVHYSNFATIFLKPFLNFQWSKRRFYSSIIFTVMFAVFFKIFFLSITDVKLVNFNNMIFWKLEYYLTYYNSVGYQYTGGLHRLLMSLMFYFPLFFSGVITIQALNKIDTIKKSRFKYLLLSSQIIGILVFVFFIVLNAPTLGMRLHFLLTIGMFFIVKEIIVSSDKKKSGLTFGITITSLVFYNFVIILYNAGIHDPMSPFFLF